MANPFLLLAIDFGGTKTRLALRPLTGGEIIATSITEEADLRERVNQLPDLVIGFLKQKADPSAPVAGIVIGAMGFPETWRPLQKELQDRYQCPVQVESDASLGAVG